MTAWMPDAQYYPIFVRVADQPVLVVGEGLLAQRKTDSMLELGARPILIAVETTFQIRAWAEQDRIEWRARPFTESDLDGCRLVFCATNDAELNRRVSEAAQRRGIPVNVVDVPDLCSFIVPSILRRGHLSIAVSTDGLCPSFSRHVRQELEGVIDTSYGQALELLEEVRAEVYRAFRDRDYDTRRRVMEAVLALDLPKIIRGEGVEAGLHSALSAVERCTAGDVA